MSASRKSPKKTAAKKSAKSPAPKTAKSPASRTAVKKTSVKKTAKSPARTTAAPARGKLPAANFQPAEPWPLRSWPALPVVSRPASEAAHFERRATTSLAIRGELLYDDAPTLRAALAALDEHAYVEFYGAKDFQVDGLRVHIDFTGELEADCTAIDEGFVALARPARSGSVVVHAGRAISARRYVAGAYGPAAVVPELPPGAVQRFGDPYRGPREDERRRVWSFPERTWSFDQSFRQAPLRVRGPDGELLAERLIERGAVDVCADGSAALVLTRDGLEVVGPDLVARCRWSVDRDLRRLAIAPDGGLVMVVDDHGERLRVRDGMDGAELWSSAGYFLDAGEFVRADRLAVAGASRRLSGGEEGLLVLDPRSGRKIAFCPYEQIREIRGDAGDSFHVVHRGRVSVHACEDGAVRGTLELVEAASDQLVRDDGAWRSPGGDLRWDAATGLPRHDHAWPIRAVAVAGPVIATHNDGFLILRDREGRVLHRGLIPATSSLSLRPDGGRVVVVHDGCVLVFEPGTGAWSRSRPLGACAAAFAPDGRLFTGHKDGSLRVWPSLAGPGEAHVVGKRPIEALAFSPGGDLVLALGSEGRGARARLVDARAFAVRCEVACNRWERAAAVTAAGTFAVGGDDGALLYDREGRRVAVLSTMNMGAAACDRERLIVGVGRLLYVVDPATGERRGVLEGHEESVSALALGPDRLYSADRRLLVWDLAALRALDWTHPLDREMVPLP